MEKIIKKFIDYCLQYQKACLSNDHRLINKKHSLFQKTFDTIKLKGQLSLLLPLLNDEHKIVRLMASSKLLPYFEEESRRALKLIEKNSEINSLSAKMILDTHDGKELRLP